MSKKSLMETESFGYWLKVTLKTGIPQISDFDGLADAFLAIGRVLLVLALRLTALATLPVSAPLLALWCIYMERKAVARRKQYREDAIRAFKGDRND